MSNINVEIGGNKSVSVAVNTQQTVGARVNTVKAGAKLENISNVAIDAASLQDGYTLVYNSTNGKWEASPASDAALTVINGGTF
jgi:hypothetical protein